MALESDSSSFASSIDSSDTTDKNSATGYSSFYTLFFTKYTSCFINEFFFFYCFERRFCIIEGPETVQDFAKMELQEIQDNIRSRRNKIFLHMEEVMMLDVSSYN